MRQTVHHARIRRKKKRRPRKKEASKQKAKAAVKKASSPPPAAKPSANDDEDGGIYGYFSEEQKAEEDKPQIEYAPDMSIKDLRGPAQAAVVAPSNYLLLIGGSLFLSDLSIICFSFWPMVFSDSVVNWQAVLETYYKSKGEKDPPKKSAASRSTRISRMRS